MKLIELFEDMPPHERAMHHEGGLVDKLEKRGFSIWARPAGSDNRFPDIGASIRIDNSIVNLHIEAKTSGSAVLASTRTWVFDGKEFHDKKERDHIDVQLLIDLINNTKGAKARGKALLKDLRRYAGKEVKSISQASFTHIPKAEREDAFNDFIENREAVLYMASGTSPEYGRMVQDFYRGKMKPKRGKNLLLLILGNEVHIVKTARMPDKRTIKKVANLLGVDDIPVLPEEFNATFECRVNPRPDRFRLDTRLDLKSPALKKMRGAVLK